MNHRTPSTRSHTVAAAGLALAVLALAALSPGCEDPLVQPPPPPVIDSPEEVIAALSRAYQAGDVDLLASILAHEPETHAEYLFRLTAPTGSGETQWGYDEEIRIHQRMFRPDSPPTGDPPVPSELWLQAITITLTKQENFSERKDLYTTGGLDSLRWRAVDARYTTYVFFDLAGTDYKVEGEANFIVINDRSKQTGDVGKFLLYIWEDIGPGAPAVTTRTSPRAASGVEPDLWGHVKQLFR